jgi:mono/diheme cytochrome c family protein
MPLGLVSTVALAVAACAPAPTAQGSGQRPAASSARGLEFARAHCSRCHAVTAGRSSPNPDAPPFEVVVNAPGLNAGTLNSWLRNAHDFPEIMNFEIDSDRIDDLAAYMLTLQREDFTPPAQ